MPNIGDTVRFLNAVGGGKVTRIDGNIVYVEDLDGFEVPALARECVVVAQAGAQPSKQQKSAPVVTEQGYVAPAPQAPAPKPSAPAPEPEVPEVIETAEGNRLNISLVFEPIDIKRLSQTEFRATLVNESNYFISFALASHDADSVLWTPVKADTLEPNFMMTVSNFTTSDFNSWRNILFQFVAYKADRDFEMKPAASVTVKMDVTKFSKLHCFKEHDCFDTPVLALDLVVDDKPYSPVKVVAATLEEAMKEKRETERRPVRPVKKKRADRADLLEVDLHINELVDTTAGLSRADMLNLQIDEFRKVMDANLRNHGRKIIFIHGKGEGVLRNALLKELSHRYKGNDVCDASFREYGFGATQVTIK